MKLLSISRRGDGYSMVELSIAIIAYNDYADIIEAINSLELCTSREISKKIYVVDNSSDNIALRIDRKKLKTQIRLLDDVEYIDTKANLGFGKGNNSVLPLLDSKYHAIVNPDIVFVEDAFKSIIEFMEGADIGMCIPKIVDDKGNMQMVYRRDPTVFDMFIRFFCKNLFKKRVAYHTLQDKDYSKPFQVPFGQGSFLVIRTELFKSLGGFDDRYFMYLEDADLCRRVNQCSKLMYFPDTKVVHKWEQASHKNVTLFKRHFASMCKYFKKWGVKFI